MFNLLWPQDKVLSPYIKKMSQYYTNNNIKLDEASTKRVYQQNT